MDRPNLFHIIKDVVISYTSWYGNLLKLLQLESKLALRTFLLIFFLAFIAGLLLVGTWFLILLFLFFYFQTFQWSSLQSIVVLTLMNIFVLISILFYIFIIKKNLFFNVSRKQFFHKATREE